MGPLLQVRVPLQAQSWAVTQAGNVGLSPMGPADSHGRAETRPRIVPDYWACGEYHIIGAHASLHTVGLALLVYGETLTCSSCSPLGAR